MKKHCPSSCDFCYGEGGGGCNSSRGERNNKIITTHGEMCERLSGISGRPAVRSVRGGASLEESDFDSLPEECVFACVCVSVL